VPLRGRKMWTLSLRPPFPSVWPLLPLSSALRVYTLRKEREIVDVEERETKLAEWPVWDARVAALAWLAKGEGWRRA